jgi:putative SOS response-associated peptidase YedK
MASWDQVVAFSQPLTTKDNDPSVTFRVMSNIPVIVWDREKQKRRVIYIRWGFPHRSNHNRPDPIHVRAETIDEKPTFKGAFLDGQRGIVMVRTFNEGRELENGKTEQHTITPGSLGAVGIAFLWRRFDVGLPVPLLACVMATVPASPLIATITDRMPAILAPEDWAKWLGEEQASPAEVKACLRTREEPDWTMRPEERPRRKPTPSNPTGLV